MRWEALLRPKLLGQTPSSGLRNQRCRGTHGTALAGQHVARHGLLLWGHGLKVGGLEAVTAQVQPAARASEVPLIPACLPCSVMRCISRL